MSKIEDEALAAAYDKALELEKSGEKKLAIAAWQEVLRLDPEDHGGASVRMASLGFGTTPDKAPDAYVATLFSQHAEVFDNVLVDQLGYAVPMQLRQLLHKHDIGSIDRLLDLGCGTGLTGVALDDMATHMTGVDIAEGMIDVAEERELFDILYVAEAVHFLQANDDPPWGLIAATDVLPYCGELNTLFATLADNLTSGGYFGFSSETLPDEWFSTSPFRVGPHQRFAHHLPYVEATLTANEMALVDVQEIIVRHEEGAPIHGHLYLAKRN